MKYVFCPSCYAKWIVKNGSTRNGKPKYLCRQCGRQWVAQPEKAIISRELCILVDNHLIEGRSITAISKATGVSRRWLQYYIKGQGQYAAAYRVDEMMEISFSDTRKTIGVYFDNAIRGFLQEKPRYSDYKIRMPSSFWFRLGSREVSVRQVLKEITIKIGKPSRVAGFLEAYFD